MVLFIFAFISQAIFSQQIIYVSNKGDDKNNGTKLLPVSSLQAAFNLAKEKNNQPVDIKVNGGNYFLNEPLVINENYSRTSKNKIRVIGEKSNKPIFYGGKKITPTLDKETNCWIINVNKNASVSGVSQILSIDGQPRKMTKFPSAGFIKPLNVIYNDGSFTVKIPSELNELLKSYSYEDIKNVFVTFYVKWTSIIRYISEYNYKESTISFKGANLPELYLIEPNKTNFTVSNIKKALKSGEWYYKDAETILYKPLEKDNIKKSLVVVAQSKEMLNIKGTATKKITYIDFENIEFNTAGANLDKNGYFPYQAAVNIESIIQLAYASNMNFTGISAKNINTNVFWIKEGSSNIKISKSNFSDLGTGAIKIGNVKYDSENQATNNIIVNNNIINKGGELYPDAVPILILDSYSNIISHNDISDFTYTGISIGWVWGYGRSLANKNIISYNHIYNIGKGILDDMGGIYTLGVSDGTIIENNVIHNVISNNYGGWGIYTDEGSSNIVIKNNLIYDCSDAGFHQHYGKENVIENNIFAFNGDTELKASRVENHLSFTFNNNIIVHNNGNFFNQIWLDVKRKEENNIYYSPLNNEKNTLDFSKNKYYIINPLLEKKDFYYLINNNDLYRLTNFKKIDFSHVGARN